MPIKFAELKMVSTVAFDISSGNFHVVLLKDKTRFSHIFISTLARCVN